MMKLKKMVPLAAVAVCGLVCGCVEPRARYVDHGEIVFGVPEQATMYDLESSVQSLMQKMLASPQFSRTTTWLKRQRAASFRLS